MRSSRHLPGLPASDRDQRIEFGKQTDLKPFFETVERKERKKKKQKKKKKNGERKVMNHRIKKKEREIETKRCIIMARTKIRLGRL